MKRTPLSHLRKKLAFRGDRPGLALRQKREDAPREGEKERWTRGHTLSVAGLVTGPLVSVAIALANNSHIESFVVAQLQAKDSPVVTVAIHDSAKHKAPPPGQLATAGPFGNFDPKDLGTGYRTYPEVCRSCESAKPAPKLVSWISPLGPVTFSFGSQKPPENSRRQSGAVFL